MPLAQNVRSPTYARRATVDSSRSIARNTKTTSASPGKIPEVGSHGPPRADSTRRRQLAE
eukprot:9636330-Lingulodinium_polyedra.AAC.1